MSEKNNGGPAFPVTNTQFIYKAGADASKAGLSVDERDRLYMEATEKAAAGMTLRDYFAAKAMGVLIDCAPDEACSASDDETVERERNEFAYDVARDAYRYADAMLRARDA